MIDWTKVTEMWGRPIRQDELATPAEVAEYLRMTEAALKQMRYRGSGPPYVKRGARVLYRWADVEDYLNASAQR